MSAPARLTASLADRYRMERELGAGGMATVYLADDVKHDRQVAIKVLRPELAAVIGAERFLKEIKTTANLQHPHILGLIDSGDADGLLWYAMPFVEGESLRDRLQREKQLPINDAVRIASEVASALDYAHRHGVIHRDIKPENILLHDGSALVADFGIALAASKSGSTRMTETGMSLGTPQYMSPEQAMGEREITARSDVYALGCITYEMLVGEPPFTGPTAQAIVAKVMTEVPKALAPQRRSVPPNVDAAVRTALEKLPADRFATAAAFAEALADSHFATRTSGVEETGRTAKPRGRVGVAIGAVLVLAVGFVAGRRFAPRTTNNATLTQPVLRFQTPAPGATPVDSRGDLFPDGSGVVFVGDGPGGRGVWVQSFSGAVPRFVAIPDVGLEPRLLPDRSGIVYYTFPSVGRARVDVASLTGAPVRVWTDSIIYGIAIDEQGRLYGTLRRTGGLARLDRSGQHIEELSAPDTAHAEAFHSTPQLLPGGRGILFQINLNAAGTAEIAALNLENRRVTRLVAGARPAFLPNGYLVFCDTTGTILAAAFSVTSLRMTSAPVPVVHGAACEFSVSENGTLLYQPDSAVGWTVRTTDEAGPRFARATGRSDPFAISPDGNRIVTTDGDGLMIIERNGVNRRLIVPPGEYTSADWVTDGEISVLRHVPGDSARLGLLPYRVHVDGGAIEPAHLPGQPRLYQLHVRPSGVTYTASNQVWWLASGADHGVAIARGSNAQLSPDGRYIAFNDSQRRIMIAAVSPIGQVWDVAAGIRPQWSADGATIYFEVLESNTPSAKALPIMMVSVKRGTAIVPGVPKLAEEPAAGATRAWAIGPRDGRIYWQLRPAPPAPMVVVNWAREVDSLVRAAGGSR